MCVHNISVMHTCSIFSLHIINTVYDIVNCQLLLLNSAVICKYVYACVIECKCACMHVYVCVCNVGDTQSHITQVMMMVMMMFNLCVIQFLLDLDDQFYAVLFEEETLKRKLCHSNTHLQPIANGHNNVNTLMVSQPVTYTHMHKHAHSYRHAYTHTHTHTQGEREREPIY